jgi:RTA1 like protein
MTKIFVIGDVLSFFIQGAGGGIMASPSGDPDKLKLGERIIIGALFLQILMFALFVLTSIIFHRRMLKRPTQQSHHPELRWQTTLYILYAVSALILLRNIFRVAEYIGGHDGVLLSVEWPVYIFDALLMVATMAVFYWGYVALVMPKIIDSEANTESLNMQTVNVSAAPRYEK